MDEFYLWRGHHVPAFGSWDYYSDLPFTQCFESATKQQSLFRCSYSPSQDHRDLYDNSNDYVMTPTMIVVPRRRGKFMGCNEYHHHPPPPRTVKKGQSKDVWVVCDYDESEDDFKVASQSPCPVKSTVIRSKPKAVDEDLYKISPHLLRQVQSKKKRAWGLFSSCLKKPACLC